VLAPFTAAAKEEMPSAFAPWSADECIRAFESEGKKPHQGGAPENLALHQGITWSNSTTALGLRSLAVENRVRSRCTGKERDAESGLDNFEARYLGSSLGRFMSPDPMGGDTNDPQSLNRYAYVRNNPLKLTDPTGLNFNLACSGPDTATCQGGLQGTTTTTTTTDANGNQTTTSTFTATEISNDKNGNLVDQNGNQYSGTFDGTNVSFTQNGSTQSSTGAWKEGSDPTSGITGGGALDDSFHFTFAQHGAGQKLNAFGYHVGSPEDAIRMLGAAGIRFSMLDTIFNVREMVDHPGALNFRSSGDQGTGANSTHLLLDRTPSATVPWAQTFNLHTGETNPWENLGAAWQHAVNEQ